MFNIFNNNLSNVNMSSTGDVTVITINGKTYNINGSNVSVRNGKIYVDGKLFKETENETNIHSEIVIHGNVGTIENHSANVSVNGDVTNGIDCGGSVSVKNNVQGNIDCGGSVNVGGDLKGSIDCGGSAIIGGRIR